MNSLIRERRESPSKFPLYTRYNQNEGAKNNEGSVLVTRVYTSMGFKFLVFALTLSLSLA